MPTGMCLSVHLCLMCLSLMCMCVFVRVYVCAYVCVSVCMSSYMYLYVVFMSVSMSASLCVSLCVHSICAYPHVCDHKHFTDMGQPSRYPFPSPLFPDCERSRTKNATWFVGMCLACSHSGNPASQTLLTMVNLKTDCAGGKK